MSLPLTLDQITKSWLLQFLNCCTQDCSIPKVWHRAKVIAVPKPEKSLTHPNIYWSISLLRDMYKLIERLSLMQIKDWIQEGTMHQRSGTLFYWKQKTRLSQDRKLVYPYWSDCSLGHQVSHWADCQAAVSYSLWANGFLQEMISKWSIILQAGEKISYLKCLRNGLLQRSVLVLLLFNIYTNSLPEMKTKKYVYADYICFADTRNNVHRNEGNLSKDMDTLTSYFLQLRLFLNETKAVATIFHLNNHFANCPISICVQGLLLLFHTVVT